MSGFHLLFVDAVAGAHGGSWPEADMAMRDSDVCFQWKWEAEGDSIVDRVARDNPEKIPRGDGRDARHSWLAGRRAAAVAGITARASPCRLRIPVGAEGASIRRWRSEAHRTACRGR